MIVTVMFIMQVLIVTVRPHLRVMFMHPLKVYLGILNKYSGSNKIKKLTSTLFTSYNAEIFCINHGDQRVSFQFVIIINVLVSSFLFI